MGLGINPCSNTLHGCMVPHHVSDMAELALPGRGTNPLLLSHASCHFLIFYAAETRWKISVGKKKQPHKKRTNQNHKPTIKSLGKDISKDRGSCWPSGARTTKVEKPQIPRTPYTSDTEKRFIYSPPPQFIPLSGGFPQPSRSVCSSISRHRSIRLSRSFSRNSLVKHVTVPGRSAIRDRHSPGSPASQLTLLFKLF